MSEKEKSKEKDKDKEREKEKKLSLKRKMETPTGASGKQGPGRPRKDRTLDQHRLMATSTPIVPVSMHVQQNVVDEQCDTSRKG